MPLRQARLLAWLAPLLLSACAVPGQINLRLIGRDISGAAAESRLPPPGMDRPSPNLASVPPIPERPDPAVRLAITTRLQGQRDALNEPLPDRRADSTLTEGAAGGVLPIPAGPPRPVALARAPAIPWTTAAPPAAPRGMGPRPAAAPEPPLDEWITPGAVPDLPSPELLAPAPPLPPRR
ncbi:hypothetical protein [Sediminicoccus sp. KRV36]|uniref:hypothetical protein n=1 Tax=Sediminicoccus sp. KRV36 TaxID=3133721 RepID=UPI00200C7FEB|nr:hypothetical protein [Sediminicoccus rosea]UPY38591.1 hypothetical protein LHU95_07810 [Sediminicoccus rosea]